MDNTRQSFPSVVRILQISFFSAVILFFGKTLFIPLFFGLLIAIVFYPVCKWLERHGWARPLAIAACLLIVGALFAALVALFVWQISVFSKELPAMLSRVEAALHQLQEWAVENIGVTNVLQNNWGEKLLGSVGGVLQSTVQTTVSTLFILFLTPVYTALFLYHRKIFVQFLKLITPVKYQHQLDSILSQTIHTYFNYIKGMVLVYIIVGILNSIGLLLLGVQHTILFGMLCAIMIIIPYVGLLVSALLPISVVWMDTGNF